MIIHRLMAFAKDVTESKKDKKKRGHLHKADAHLIAN